MNLRPDQETTSVRGSVLLDPIGVEQEALEELFSRCRIRLYNTAFRLLRNHEDAEDALQDGMLAAFRHLNTFEHRSQLSTWLTRIVVNSALMRRRQYRPGRTVSIDESLDQGYQTLAGSLPDPRPNPEETYARQEQVQLLERVLEAMPSAYRRALRLRHLQGMSIKEAAQTAGLATSTVKCQLHRARLWLGKRAAESRQLMRRTRTAKHGLAHKRAAGRIATELSPLG